MKEDTYYSRNRETVLEKVKTYREANKGYYKAYYDVYYKKNKDSLNEKRRIKRQAQPKPVKQKPVKLQEPVKLQDLPVFLEPEPVSTVQYVNHDFTVKFD